mmetsp:Transcript_59580/g.141772  ORF Transcript_59580/g.141772 Transcript_59580/m.141772 type:complete len:410 (+) Transcript_59580:106-1335(+)
MIPLENPKLFRPSRTCYPGSKYGPKSRYDLPQRHLSYHHTGAKDDEIETTITDSRLRMPMSLNLTSPRRESAGRDWLNDSGGVDVLSGAARFMLKSSFRDRHLSDRSWVYPDNDAHGVMLLGPLGCGKTSVLLSMLASITGSFPSRHDLEQQQLKAILSSYGQGYELPLEQQVRVGDEVKSVRVIVTDTTPCTRGGKDGNPLCLSVSPNSAHHFNAIPSWMRMTLREGKYPHFGVVVVLDALATPLWEDEVHCRDLARVMAVLRRSQYAVVIAVTKLYRAREIARRDANYGVDHGGQVGKDPHVSYETFVSRYIGKTCAALQAKAKDNDWATVAAPAVPSKPEDEADSPPFPLNNATIFDIPTWISVGDFAKWQERRGTSELPNFKYFTSQLQKLLFAVSVQPPKTDGD